MNTAARAGDFEIGKILKLPVFFVCKKRKGEDDEKGKTYRTGFEAGPPALDCFKRERKTPVPEDAFAARPVVPYLLLPESGMPSVPIQMAL